MLFGNIVEVRKCSENFLKDLEDHWQDDIFLTKVNEILRDHANENFEIYKSYSKKYLDMTQKYSDLIAQKGDFKDLLEKLRQSPPAENLPMDSFFALPIQRIARYHMLVENVLKFMKKNCDEYEEILTLWENLKEVSRLKTRPLVCYSTAATLVVEFGIKKLKCYNFFCCSLLNSAILKFKKEKGLRKW